MKSSVTSAVFLLLTGPAVGLSLPLSGVVGGVLPSLAPGGGGVLPSLAPGGGGGGGGAPPSPSATKTGPKHPSGTAGAPGYAGVGSLNDFVASYALAVDNKDQSAVAALFAPNAVATYTSPDQTVTGNTAIAGHDLGAFSGVNTFHNIVPMTATYAGNGTVEMINYFTATIFGKDCYTGQIVTAYGSYHDTVEVINGAYAITKRAQTYANPADPYIGNIAIVLGPACNSTSKSSSSK